MISINNITVAFGGFTLLDDISFHVSDGEHIALVGKNGAGKSTILKLIAGVEHPTSGSIMKPKEQTVGYLPQIMSYSKDTTVIEAAMSVFADHFTMGERVEEISRELGERTDYESAAYHRLIEELNELNDKLAMAQSESPAVLAEKTLVGLGFKKIELAQHILAGLEHARGTGQGSADQARCASAGRAHQPSGHRIHTVAGGLSVRLSWLSGAHFPRPPLPGPGDHQDGGDSPRSHLRLQGAVFQVC